MNIFQMKTKPHNIERFRQFIDEKFVCIGWPGINNLDQVSKDEIRQRLAKEYGFIGHKLGNALGQVNTFVNTMKNGDIVIIVENDYANFGILGDYVYVQKFDNQNDHMCHQRSVEWMDKVQITSLDSSIQKFLSNRNVICQYPESFDESGLNAILGKQPRLSKNNTEKYDDLFNKALEIIDEELKSEDPDRRFKAATELIRLRINL